MRDSHSLTYGRRRDGEKPSLSKEKSPTRRRFKFPLILLGLITVALILSLYLYLTTGKVVGMLRRGERISTLLIGSDDVDNSFRADTILLTIYSPEEKRLDLISIPRDTMVIGADGKLDKLNHLFAYDRRRLGAEDASSNLAEIIGKNLAVRISFYAHTNYLGFIRLVDIAGGVRVDVDSDMSYVDQAGGLSINIKKGPQTLDGKMALDYARYRSPGIADLGRMDRQGKLLESLARQLERPPSLARLPKIANLIRRNVHTNLTPPDLLALFREFKEDNGVTIQSAILPGAPTWVQGSSYWRTNASRTKTLIDDIVSPDDNMSSRPPTYQENETVKVEVLNGVGIDRIGERMALFLSRRPELDVIEVKNANHFDYVKTTVVSRKGNQTPAKKVASLMGIKEELLSDFDRGAIADVSVIVGRDYKRWIDNH